MNKKERSYRGLGRALAIVVQGEKKSIAWLNNAMTLPLFYFAEAHTAAIKRKKINRVMSDRLMAVLDEVEIEQLDHNPLPVAMQVVVQLAFDKQRYVDSTPFSKLLTGALERKTISQTELAAIMAIPQSRISEHCNGKVMPRNSQIKEYEDALGVERGSLGGY
ncbi:helix-turn-helix domain-containing protein [Paenibacillus sp. GCM10012307]|uniref:Helix-turn-helix transcriptional regulator n=1 Tax=Paenibacillus roseus TaxID=2798579 RepID=A0A934MQP3_9BACL|nr:helix-turn-helix transcriptional regulator [Paenibacillus roseus]MBJ6361554.1 helix-turn-helix transcriptional regulator [Paenibacillus roseus]